MFSFYPAETFAEARERESAERMAEIMERWSRDLDRRILEAMWKSLTEHQRLIMYADAI